MGIEKSTNVAGEITVVVDHDSVCAGDDGESHLTSFSVSASTTIAEFLQLLKSARYLASIQGGNATWLIECIAHNEKRCIGVVAQQWSTSQLLIPRDTLLVDLRSGSELLLSFRYRAQADPSDVFACLQAGQALSQRYAT